MRVYKSIEEYRAAEMHGEFNKLFDYNTVINNQPLFEVLSKHLISVNSTLDKKQEVEMVALLIAEITILSENGTSRCDTYVLSIIFTKFSLYYNEFNEADINLIAERAQELLSVKFPRGYNPRIIKLVTHLLKET